MAALPGNNNSKRRSNRKYKTNKKKKRENNSNLIYGDNASVYAESEVSDNSWINDFDDIQINPSAVKPKPGVTKGGTPQPPAASPPFPMLPPVPENHGFAPFIDDSKQNDAGYAVNDQQPGSYASYAAVSYSDYDGSNQARPSQDIRNSPVKCQMNKPRLPPPRSQHEILAEERYLKDDYPEDPVDNLDIDERAYYRTAPSAPAVPPKLSHTYGCGYLSSGMLTSKWADWFAMICKGVSFGVLMVMMTVYFWRVNLIQSPNDLSTKERIDYYIQSIFDFKFSPIELYKRYAMSKRAIPGYRKIAAFNFKELPAGEKNNFLRFLEKAGFVATKIEDNKVIDGIRLWEIKKDKENGIYVQLVKSDLLRVLMQMINGLFNDVKNFKSAELGPGSLMFYKDAFHFSLV